MFKIYEYVKIIYFLSKPSRRWQAGCLAVLATVVAFVELFVAGSLSLLGLAMSSPDAISGGRFFEILNSFFELSYVLKTPIDVLFFVLFVVFVGVLFKNVLLIFSTYLQQYYSSAVESDISSIYFNKILSMPYSWHIKQNSSKLLSVYGYKSQVGFLISSLLLFFTQFLVAVVLVVGGLFLATVPMLIVLLVCFLFALLTYCYSRKRSFSCNMILAVNNKDFHENSLAAFQGIREVKVFGRQKAFSSINSDILEVNKRVAPRSLLYPMLPFWVLEAAGVLTLLLALAFLMSQGVSFSEANSILALLAGLAWRLMPCVNKMISCLIRFRGLMPYLEMFFDRLEGGDASACVKLQGGGGRGFKQELLLDCVSFRYPEGDVDALSKVTLSIKRGCMVGVIGCSGAGKSTLLGVLTGLFAPAEGDIVLDGLALGEERESVLTSLIGYVPQSPYLMHATLAENVAFSEWGEPVDNERVIRACRLAAVDFIDQLPEGLNTLVGERGVRLSGGQAQRVAIARALYSEPQLVVFDEATSALDGAAEGVIQKTVNSLRDSMTLVIIAHRLSTVENCDILYWLEEGRLKEVGTPAEVLPRYKEMLKIREAMGLEGRGV